jgi:hypothetical protein
VAAARATRIAGRAAALLVLMAVSGGALVPLLSQPVPGLPLSTAVWPTRPPGTEVDQRARERGVALPFCAAGQKL